MPIPLAFSVRKSSSMMMTGKRNLMEAGWLAGWSADYPRSPKQAATGPPIRVYAHATCLCYTVLQRAAPRLRPGGQH